MVYKQYLSKLNTFGNALVYNLSLFRFVTLIKPAWTFPVLLRILEYRKCYFYHIIFFIFLIKQNQYLAFCVKKKKKSFPQYTILCMFNNLTRAFHLGFHIPLICWWLWHNLLDIFYFPLFLNLCEDGKVNYTQVYEPLLSLFPALPCVFIYYPHFPLCFFP